MRDLSSSFNRAVWPRVRLRGASRKSASGRSGREVGWQIRFEKRFTRDTRLLVVTEGILTARLQQDPLLSDFATIVLDEFHERSIHADLGLALARQAWLARDDLRIVVMSATLDVQSVARFLGDAPVVNVPGALHPLTIEHGEGESIVEAARNVLPRTTGQVLCFLPGAREIERAGAELDALRRDMRRASSQDVEIVPLHGSLDGDAQDAAIRAVDRRRIILATNIAETSLTVPGVSAVIDTGQVKVARYDADRGVDSLTLERITMDSADQRAGRAARLGPGLVRRLWDARDRLRPHREPEIARVDLAAPVLDLLAWGADPLSFDWFEAPSADRIHAALRLLHRLGAIDGDGGGARITTLGRQMQRVPLHPRLARILIDGRGAPEAAVACANCRWVRRVRWVRWVRRVHGCDGCSGAAESRRNCSVLRAMRSAATLRRTSLMSRCVMRSSPAMPIGLRSAGPVSTTGFSWPAVTARRSPASPQASTVITSWRWMSWQQSARESASRESVRPAGSSASGFSRRRPRSSTGSTRKAAARVRRASNATMPSCSAKRPYRVDTLAAASLLAEAWLAREHDAATTQLLRRLRFAAIDVDLRALVNQAAASARTVSEIDLGAHLPFDLKRSLADRAPASIVVPSGRSMTLDYADDGSVSASVKLQELFGLAESPTIGAARVPVTFHLLAPNGRPVQTTRDLRSFWERTYPEVRKELRGRYPKHPWPEDPWTAQPTHRTTRRGKG